LERLPGLTYYHDRPAGFMSRWLTMIEVAALQSDAFCCGRVARTPHDDLGRPGDPLAAWLPGGYLSTRVEKSPGWRCTIPGCWMSSGVPLKVYRPKPLSMLFGGLCALGFFIIGLSMLLDERESGGVSSVVIGTLVLLLSLWCAVTLTTSRLIVTPAGLVYSRNLRRRTFGWSQIRSFGVGRSRSPSPWAALIINLDSGRVMVYCVTGTGRYVARAADELRQLQHTYAPDQAADGVPPGALSS
jgi:hypothetical protein